MAMLDSISDSFEYPLLRSFYSGEAVKHADWLEEIKKRLFVR